MSDSTLALYVTALAKWPIDSVQNVCTKVATSPRREGETAFPALGDLLEALRMHRAAKAQDNANRLERESREQDFWDHIDYLKKTTGKSEQEVLDSIKATGYTGRKARNHES